MRKFLNLTLTALLACVGFAALSHSDTGRVEARTVVASTAAYGAKSKGQRALDYAKTKKGRYNYRYGGNGPTKFDCSGLTKWAYGKVGISLPRTSGAQRSTSKTYHVSRAKARQGDLVFWGSGHVELLVKIYKKNGRWYTQTFGAGNRRTGIRYRTVSGVPHIERVKGA